MEFLVCKHGLWERKPTKCSLQWSHNACWTNPEGIGCCLMQLVPPQVCVVWWKIIIMQWLFQCRYARGLLDMKFILMFLTWVYVVSLLFNDLLIFFTCKLKILIMSCNILVVLWSLKWLPCWSHFWLLHFITASKCTQHLGPNVGPMF
jgi:hypothetical protein